MSALVNFPTDTKKALAFTPRTSNSVSYLKKDLNKSKPSETNINNSVYDALICMGLMLILCIPLVLAAFITGS